MRTDTQPVLVSEARSAHPDEFPELGEYLPIKLTPGFIVVAFRLGCINCNFCCVATDRFRRQLFQSGHQFQYPVSAADVYGWLQLMPSFMKARVPLRLGNDTDYVFQREDTLELLELLPEDYPVAILTRFPISRDDIRLLSHRKNVVLKVTVTPSSSFLNSPKNDAAVIDTVNAYPGSTFVTLGPLILDNYERALELMASLKPRNSLRLHFKLLNKEYDRDIQHIKELRNDQLASLQDVGRRNGFTVTTQLMCATNSLLGIRHKRVSDIAAEERSICESCRSNALCYARESINAHDIVGEAEQQLGLHIVGKVERVGFRSFVASTDSPTAYGDEAYLSELFGAKIKLKNTPAGTLNHRIAATEDVLNRWEKYHFFPYESIRTRCKSFLTTIDRRTTQDVH